MLLGLLRRICVVRRVVAIRLILGAGGPLRFAREGFEGTGVEEIVIRPGLGFGVIERGSGVRARGAGVVSFAYAGLLAPPLAPLMTVAMGGGEAGQKGGDLQELMQCRGEPSSLARLASVGLGGARGGPWRRFPRT